MRVARVHRWRRRIRTPLLRGGTILLALACQRTDEPHYDRHVWLYRDNPNGVFAQFNPNATCKHHKGGSHKH